MRIVYHQLEIAGIVIFLSCGGFLIYDSLAQPGQPVELIGGSVLLALGGALAGTLARTLLRLFQQDRSHE